MRARFLAALTLSLFIAAGVAVGKGLPDRIDLPDGWQPEGVAAGHGHELFVGSIPTGAVYRVDARTGEGSVAVPPHEGSSAIGLKVDRAGRLFVAGGETGKAFVYDAASGADVAEFQLAPEGEPTFVNDVVLTKRTAYFTDSQRAVLYAIDLDLGDFEELPLDGFQLEPGFNLNGIEVAKHGDALLAVQGNVGRLWRIDPDTGASEVVDVGGADLTNGDGLLLRGRRLYVVRNQDNEIAVLRLGCRLESARLIRTITDEGFDVPTTIARVGGSLYAANARFNTEPTPETEYWLTRVRH